MTDLEFARDWRQVRVFTSSPAVQWYAELLVEVVQPFASSHENALFFSQYCCPKGFDEDDTNINGIPPKFLHAWCNSSLHRSVRIRFRNEPSVEGSLRAILCGQASKYWYSAFLDFPLVPGLANGRWAPCKRTPTDLNRRARLVAELLSCNARLILDALEIAGNIAKLEDNRDAENITLGSTVCSVAHMVAQPWIDHTWFNGAQQVKFIKAFGVGPPYPIA